MVENSSGFSYSGCVSESGSNLESGEKCNLAPLGGLGHHLLEFRQEGLLLNNCVF
jgi:hypothetical protein